MLLTTSGRLMDLRFADYKGISTATEAGIADVQELTTFIAERRIPAIFCGIVCLFKES